MSGFCFALVMSKTVWVDAQPSCPLRLVGTQPSAKVLPPSPELLDITAPTLFDESFQPVKTKEEGYKLQSKEEDGLRTLCQELTKLFHDNFHAYQVLYHEELIEPVDSTRRTVAYIIEVDDHLVCCSKEDIQDFDLYELKCARISLTAPNSDLARLAPRTHKDYESNDAHDVLAFRDLLGFATRKVWPDGDMFEGMPDEIDTEYVWHPLLQKSSLVNHMKFFRNGTETHEWKDGKWQAIARSAIEDLYFKRYTGVYIKEFYFLEAKLGLHGVNWSQQYDPANALGMARGVTQWYVACSKITFDLPGNLRKYANENKSLFDTNTQSLIDTCLSSTDTFDDKLAELVATLSRYYPSRLTEFCETMSEETTNRDNQEGQLQGGAKLRFLTKWFFSTLGALGMLLQHGAAHDIVKQLNAQDNDLANNSLLNNATTTLVTNNTNVETTDPTKQTSPTNPDGVKLPDPNPDGVTLRDPTNPDGVTLSDPTEPDGVTLRDPTTSDGVTSTDASSAVEAVSLASASAALVATKSLGNSSHDPKQVATSTDPDRSLFRQKDYDWVVQMDDNVFKSLRQKLANTQYLLGKKSVVVKKAGTQDGPSLAIEYVNMLVASKDVIDWSDDMKHDLNSLSGHLASLAQNSSRDVLDNLFKLESGRRILASLTHWVVGTQNVQTLTAVRDGLEVCYTEGNIFYTLDLTTLGNSLTSSYSQANPCDNHNVVSKLIGLTPLQNDDLKLGSQLVGLSEKHPHSQVLRFTIHILRGLMILEYGIELETFDGVNEQYLKDLRDFVNALKDGLTKPPDSVTLVESVVKDLQPIARMFECMPRRIRSIFPLGTYENVVQDLRYAEAMYKCWRHDHLEYPPSVLGSFLDKFYDIAKKSTSIGLSSETSRDPELVEWLVVLKHSQNYLSEIAQACVSAVETQVSQQPGKSVDDMLSDLKNKTRLGEIITKWRDAALAIPLVDEKYDPHFNTNVGVDIIKKAWVKSFPPICAWAQFDVTHLTGLGSEFERVVTWIKNMPIYDVESINYGRLVGVLAYFATDLFSQKQGQAAFYEDLRTLKQLSYSLLVNPHTDVSVFKESLKTSANVIYRMIEDMLHQTQDVPTFDPLRPHLPDPKEDDQIKNLLFALHTTLKPHVELIPVPPPSPHPGPPPPSPSPSPPGGEHVDKREKTLLLYEWAYKPSSSFQLVSTQGVFPEVTRYLREATLDKCLEGSGLSVDQIRWLEAWAQSLTEQDSFKAFNRVM